jgi:hypothetical protein
LYSGYKRIHLYGEIEYLESGVSEPARKDQTSDIKRKVQKLLSKLMSGLSTELKRRVTPCHIEPPHLYRLSKIRNKDVPLRPVVSSIVSACCTLAFFVAEDFESSGWSHRVVCQEF